MTCRPLQIPFLASPTQELGQVQQWQVIVVGSEI
jgi:hypothetical protein